MKPIKKTHQNLKANRSQFQFIVAGLAENALFLLNYKSNNLGLSKHYEYEIQLQTHYDIHEKALENQKACIITSWTGEDIYTHGIITRWRDLGPSQNSLRRCTVITLSSPLFTLSQRVTPRIFLNENIVDIARKILTGTGWPAKDLVLKVKQIDIKPTMTMQLYETDLAFFERILAQYGLFYSFLQDSDGVKILITDNVQELPSFPDKTLTYQSQSGTVRPIESIDIFTERTCTLTDDIKLKTHHYETPETGMTADSANHTAVKGHGTQYLYGEHYKTLQTGIHLAKLRQEAIDWQRQTYSGKTDCRGLQIGQRFTLTDHPINALNGDYRIITMEQQANHDPQDLTYQAKFLAIRAKCPYRTPPKPPPPFHHILPALIESTGGDYAYLDQQGRYRVRFPFDQSKKQQGQGSPPTRSLQPHGSPSKVNQPIGIHYPLHAKTQVAIGFTNGDLNKPNIIGVITNPTHASPVTSTNKTQNTLRTWGGNELTTEEIKDHQYLVLTTRDHKNKLKLDAKKDNHKIIITTDEGQLETYAKKTIKIHTDGNYITTSGKDHLTTIKRSQRILTKKGNIELHSARNIQMIAGRKLQTKTDYNGVHGSDITIKSAKDLKSETQEDFSLTTTQNNFKIQAANKIHFNTRKDFTLQGEGNANIFIGQPGGGITVTPSGDLNISGPTVTLQAPQINIYGLS